MADVIKKPEPFSRKSALLILAGVVLGVFALVRGVLDYQFYNSPFDEVDYAPEAGEGFLPLFSSVDPEVQTTSLAPVLEPGRQEALAGMPVLVPTSVSELDSQTRTDTGANGATTILPDSEGQFPAGDLDRNLTGAPATNLVFANRQTWTPETISIPSIRVVAPIVPVSHTEIEYKNQIFKQWQAPNIYAAGWHNTSASLGISGNTVLNGHHNAFEEVFRDLIEVQEGDLIHLTSGGRIFTYQVGLKLVLNERFESVDVRLANAQWILPSQDERLTLITCWPYESNTHRVILVAIPTTTERLNDTPE